MIRYPKTDPKTSHMGALWWTIDHIRRNYTEQD